MVARHFVTVTLLLLLVAPAGPRCAAQATGGGDERPHARTDLPACRAVHEAADARDVAALLAMADRDSTIRADVLLALGSVQSGAGLAFIVRQLSSACSELRYAAAFAAGQTLRGAFHADAQAALLRCLASETELDVVGELLVALGRCGTRDALDAVVAGVFAPVDPAFHAVLLGLRSRAVSLFARRALRSEAATRLVADAARGALERGDPSVNLTVAMHAFSCIADSALLAPHEGLLLAGLRSFDSETRMFAASALGRLRTQAAREALCRLGMDNDWRVHVNALRALAACATSGREARERIAPFLCVEARSPSPHVRLVAVQSLAALGCADDSSRATLRRTLEADTVEAVRGEALRSYAALAPAQAAGMLRDMARDARRLSPSALEAIGVLIERSVAERSAVEPSAEVRSTSDRSVADAEAFLPILARHLTDASSTAAAAAATVWGNAWRLERRVKRCKAGDARDRNYRSALLAALGVHSQRQAQHPAAVQAIVDILQDPLLAQRGDAKAVAEALSRFAGTNNVETVTLLLTALSALGDASVKGVVRGYLCDSSAAVRTAARAACENLKLPCPPCPALKRARFDWSLLHALPGNPMAWIATNKGMILAELLKDEAPFTVDAFIRLARSGFYAGLTFHRVVPNFVVQGGDPLGDGCGGPPFTLRSEFSPRTFARGCIGMASSGKDTEGSQFFIMHSFNPHLDGRYTLFGNVIDGMDVVDRLMPGDRILSVTVKE